jgi:molybdopterin-guanine dinucleotide biosynthesis protein A
VTCEAYDAIVLTGGRARRLGGAHKPGIRLGGRPLAARVVEAVSDAAHVVMVGAPVPGVRADAVTQEVPVGAGPMAAVAAGLAHVRAAVVATLAGDLPFLTSGAVCELRLALAAEPSAAAAVLVDDAGRDQPLCAVWRAELLRDTLSVVSRPRSLSGVGGNGLTGLPMRLLLAAAEPVVRRTATTAGAPPPWFDCDTDEDLAQAREWQETTPRERGERSAGPDASLPRDGPERSEDPG